MLGSVLRFSLHKTKRNSQGFLFGGDRIRYRVQQDTGQQVKKINLCKFEKPLAVLACFFIDEIFWEGERSFTQGSRFVSKYVIVCCSKMAPML